MLLKLLAPVRTNFSIVGERTIQQPRLYASFWDEANRDAYELWEHLPNQNAWSPQLDELRFAHRTEHYAGLNGGAQYRTLTDDSLARSMHILELHLQPDHLTLTAEKDSAEDLLNSLSSVIVRVYDYHIALVEANISLGHQLQHFPKDELAPYLEKLEEDSTHVGEYLSHWINDHVLEILFAWLKKRPRAETYIDMTSRQMSREKVMWVTRSLLFEENAPSNRDEIIHHWLINSGGAEVVDGMTEIERIQHDEDGYLIRWLNYLFREEAYKHPGDAPLPPNELAQPISDAWEALLNAQYYYATLDVVDSYLTTILADAWMPSADLNLASLKDILEYHIRNANLMLIERHDNAKYYRRTVKSELDNILDFWAFEYVLVRPVERKIELCEARLQLLMQEEAAKSAIFTDMILLGIGVTGIFGTFLALAEFGRTMATDVELASYDINSTNIIEWLAVQPTDFILAMSVGLSALLAILYLYFRQRQNLS